MYSPVSYGQFLIGNNQVGVNFQFDPQTGTGRTGTMRTVKAECPGGNLTHADTTINTGKVLREQQYITFKNGYQHYSGPKFEGSLYRISNTALAATLSDY